MVYIKHVESVKQWKQLEFTDRRLLYSHHRDIRKLPRCVVMSNRNMPVRIFDNKCKFDQIMQGSPYYPPEPKAGDLVIVKKALSSCGQGHYITQMDSESSFPANVCIQKLVLDPLLINGCKFSMRILIGFSRECFIMPYENALILVCNEPYACSELSTELTNSSCKANNVNKFPTLREALIQNECLDAFIQNMDRLSSDLKTRFCPHVRPNSFDVHGIDVLVQKDGTPIVIETNPYWYSGHVGGGFVDKLEMFRTIVTTLSKHIDA